LGRGAGALVILVSCFSRYVIDKYCKPVRVPGLSFMERLGSSCPKPHLRALI
jgi:hypothetical protein